MDPSKVTKTVLVDLRCCQVNQDRGIPAYAQNLVIHFRDRNPDYRFIWMIEKKKPFPSRKKELSARGEWRVEQQMRSDSALQVDIFLSTCFFMDLHRRGEEYLMPAWLKAHAPLRLGIVYDLIPLIFQEHYLPSHESRETFLASLRQMRSYDLLFAISEATRRDIIRYGGVAPHLVKTLPGGVDRKKQDLLSHPSPPGIPAKFSLGQGYFIYVGGEDWRKNLEGLIHGFAIFRSATGMLPSAPQLAIVCRMSEPGKARLLALAASLGLPDGAVVCTGLVSDGEFLALNRSASAMVFPSFYEGLGLPILEAYACGIPVLGSDNSSIRNLVHPLCRFDPASPDAIAKALARIRDQPSLAADSLDFGRRVLGQLSWDDSADLLTASITNAPRPAPPPSPHSRLAVVGVLPPQNTGIAAYTLRHLQSEHWGTDFFTRSRPCSGPEEAPNLLAGNRILPQEILSLALRRESYQHAIFVLGNSRHHEGALEAMLATRLDASATRWAYLHEADIWALLSGFLGPHSKSFLPEEPVEGPPDAPEWIRRALRAFPGLRPSLQFLRRKGRLDGLLVNSRACRELVLAALGEEAHGWIIHALFLPIAPSETSFQSSPDEPLRVGFFGVPAVNKLPELVLEAFDLLQTRHKAHLTLAGWGTHRFGEARRILDREDITCLESPSDQQLFQAMASVDVAVQLRVPTMGESSGVVGQLLALGKSVIVTDEGSYTEFHDDWVLKVPPSVDAAALSESMARARRERTTAKQADILAAQGPEAFEARLIEALAIALPPSTVKRES